MNELTLGNSASLLLARGYAPTPLGNDGKPLGPVYAVQVDWERNPAYSDAPVAVLTSAPMPQGPHAPIQNAQDTWLATVTVSVRDEVKAAADAIVKRYGGAGRLPVRVADGEAIFVFKLAGERFSTIGTAYGHQPDTVRVDSAAHFVPLNGQWRDGISLLDVVRNDLPPLSRDHAQALIDDVERLLDERAPRIASVLPPRVPRPLLEPGQTLRYGNRRAMDVLKANGFAPLPVRSGQQEAERNGYADFMGRWHYNVDVSEHGVGISLKGFALVEFATRFRADVDEAVKAMGACLIRTAAGDDRIYLFRSDQSGGPAPRFEEIIFAPNVQLKVRRVGLLVLSDEQGREYQWSRDVLTVKANELAAFELHDAHHLQRVLESLPPTDYSKATPAPKRGRKTA